MTDAPPDEQLLIRRGLAVFLVAVGAVLLLGAWIVDRDSFWANVSVEVGATLFLVVPLYFLQRDLERRASTAREEHRKAVEELHRRVEQAEATIRRELANIIEARGRLEREESDLGG